MKKYKNYVTYDEMVFPSTTIWRYMDFTKFVDFILTDKLWFSRIDNFNDDKEGYLEIENFHKHCYLISHGVDGIEMMTSDEKIVNENIVEVDDFIEAKFEKIKKNIKGVYVNSWHISDEENELMWRVYGKGNNCIALKCTVEDIINTLSDQSNYHFDIRKIEYANHKDIKFNLDDQLAPVFIKRRRYKSENELRIIAYKYVMADQGDFNFKVFMNDRIEARGIKIDFNRLNYKVIINPDADKMFKNLIFELRKNFQFDIETIDI